MEEFKDRILKLEDSYNDLAYITKIGENKVLITAPHTMLQMHEDGSYKLSEPFTKAIALYVGSITNSSYLVKNKDTGIDPNHCIKDTFKSMLLDIIKDQDIKLIIDIHGAKEDRDFDIEFGTLNNLTTDFSVIKELEDAFNEVGIKNVSYNEPFKGGMITKTIYENTNCDVMQIEINAKYRNIENPDNIMQVCNALINFINQYTDITNK